MRLARVDLQRADRLAHAARWVADKLDDDGCRAQSLRATGHVRFIRGKYTEALEHYDAAVKLFRRVGREVDVARTLNGALQSLISLGRYEEALASAAAGATDLRAARRRRSAWRVSTATSPTSCAARIGSTRRWRSTERAYEQLAATGEPQDVAAVLSNMAVCLHQPQ